jgi:flagellar protein FliS
MSTSDPLELIIMLYDGAIESLEKAAIATTGRQTAVKLRFIDKAIAIIDELLNCLNPEVGGEVAENLMNLYLYMMQELTLANARNDADKMLEIGALLRQLRESWVSVKGTA